MIWHAGCTTRLAPNSTSPKWISPIQCICCAEILGSITVCQVAVSYFHRVVLVAMILTVYTANCQTWAESFHILRIKCLAVTISNTPATFSFSLLHGKIQEAPMITMRQSGSRCLKTLRNTLPEKFIVWTKGSGQNSNCRLTATENWWLTGGKKKAIQLLPAIWNDINVCLALTEQSFTPDLPG